MLVERCAPARDEKRVHCALVGGGLKILRIAAMARFRTVVHRGIGKGQGEEGHGRRSGRILCTIAECASGLWLL